MVVFSGPFEFLLSQDWFGVNDDLAFLVLFLLVAAGGSFVAYFLSWYFNF
jgi:hypothetical protein